MKVLILLIALLKASFAFANSEDVRRIEGVKYMGHLCENPCLIKFKIGDDFQTFEIHKELVQKYEDGLKPEFSNPPYVNVTIYVYKNREIIRIEDADRRVIASKYVMLTQPKPHIAAGDLEVEQLSHAERINAAELYWFDCNRYKNNLDGKCILKVGLKDGSTFRMSANKELVWPFSLNRALLDSKINLLVYENREIIRIEDSSGKLISQKIDYTN